jgi:hypothetical protein
LVVVRSATITAADVAPAAWPEWMIARLPVAGFIT